MRLNKIKLSVKLALMLCLASYFSFAQVPKPSSVLSTGFYTVNGKIYDANGNEFIMRGVNSVHVWGDGPKSLDALSNQIPKTKANTVRIMTKTFWNDQSVTPAQKRDLVKRAVDAKMIPLLTTHDATCNSVYDDNNVDGHLGLKQVIDHWVLPENVQMMKDYERYLILDIANEWGSGDDSNSWKEGYKTAIARLRNAGINVMLMIEPGNCGQNPIQIRDYYNELNQHDPQHNIVMSFHMYAFFRTAGQSGVGSWCGGADCPPWRFEDRLQELIDRKIPVVIGEFGFTGASDTPYDTKTVMCHSNSKGIGWIAWSWEANGDPLLDMVYDYTYNSDADLKDYGKLVVNDACGLKANAVRASVFGSTADTQAPTTPASLSSPSKTSNSVNLSWAPSTDNFGVTGYEVFIGSSTTPAATSTTTSVTVTGLAASTTYSFTVKAKDAAGNRSQESSALSVTTNATSTLRDPENPVSTAGGLDYRYYEGTWSILPNFDGLTAAKTGTVSNFDMSVRNRADNYGFKYTGFVNIATDGTYTFYTSSDDGSKLYIGTTEVVNNDGLHGPQERSGSIGLKAGKHAIAVVFFKAGGGEGLTVSYEGPGLTKQAIPNSALFRASGSTTLTKATGTAFGTAPWTNCTTCTYDKVFDGNTSTYFDANSANGAYAGIDAGSARVITRIRYYPRSTNLDRMTGGKFQGSNTSNNSGFVDLYTVPSQPSNAWQQVDIPNTTGYRYLRYLSPNGGYGNVAEVEFYYNSGSGSRESFEIINGSEGISVFPNPASAEVNIRIYSREKGKAKVGLTNSVNQRMIKKDFQVEKGENVLTLQTGNLPTGIYILSVTNASFRSVRKIMIE